MSRSNDPVPVETRLQIVLAVMSGETTIAEVARRHGVSAESINRWRNRFVDAGKAAMEDGMPGGKGAGRGNSSNADSGPRSRSSSWRWPGRRCSCGSGRKARSTSIRSLRRPRGPESGSAAAVARFAVLVGIPERSYRRRLARLRAGDAAAKGPWPALAVGAIEALAAECAADWPAWGHRKIAAMMCADGHAVSTSTIERALRRRGLLLPRGFRANRKSSAATH